MGLKEDTWGDRRRIITSKQFIDALIAVGVVRIEDLVTRVVIDAQVNNVVTIYVDRRGDERLLDVVRTLEGVEIKLAEALS